MSQPSSSARFVIARSVAVGADDRVRSDLSECTLPTTRVRKPGHRAGLFRIRRGSRFGANADFSSSSPQFSRGCAPRSGVSCAGRSIRARVCPLDEGAFRAGPSCLGVCRGMCGVLAHPRHGERPWRFCIGRTERGARLSDFGDGRARHRATRRRDRLGLIRGRAAGRPGRPGDDSRIDERVQRTGAAGLPHPWQFSQGPDGQSSAPSSTAPNSTATSRASGGRARRAAAERPGRLDDLHGSARQDAPQGRPGARVRRGGDRALPAPTIRTRRTPSRASASGTRTAEAR